MAVSYPSGFSFAEKKGFKEEEQHLNAAIKATQDKLGSDWTLTVDWEAFENQIKEANKRKFLGVYIYQRYLGGAVAKEIAEWTDLAEAINDKVKGKKIVVTAKVVQQKYAVTVSEESIELALKPEMIEYSYPIDSKSTFTKLVEQQV